MPPEPINPVQVGPESTSPGPASGSLPAKPPSPSDSPSATNPQGLILQDGAQQHPKREWEDQKVKEAALELAKNFPRVTKIKVCYSVKDDQWWVTLFDNAGAYTDLKPYTWNRNLEKLQVFLVVNRIPSTRVQEQLNQEEPGKACEVLDANQPKGP
jgi:hypothetical protein